MNQDKRREATIEAAYKRQVGTPRFSRDEIRLVADLLTPSEQPQEGEGRVVEGQVEHTPSSHPPALATPSNSACEHHLEITRDGGIGEWLVYCVKCRKVIGKPTGDLSRPAPSNPGDPTSFEAEVDAAEAALYAHFEEREWSKIRPAEIAHIALIAAKSLQPQEGGT